jgi:hypothetical protein
MATLSRRIRKASTMPRHSLATPNAHNVRLGGKNKGRVRGLPTSQLLPWAPTLDFVPIYPSAGAEIPTCTAGAPIGHP